MHPTSVETRPDRRTWARRQGGRTHMTNRSARTRRARLAGVLGLVVALSGLVVVATATPAAADGPGVGTPWVVTVGDSAISGEAGRWAGNTNDSYTKVDALGPTAYYDNAANTAETIPGCHRSKAAEAFIGVTPAANLACSGARTYTQTSGDFKPGFDWYSDSSGRKSQVVMLQQFASTHNVKAVTVLVGANNFNFADIVQTCVTNWLTSPSWWKNYCYDDSSIKANFTSTNIANQTAAIRNALLNVRQAMTNAGYSTSQYTIVVQTYSSPIPHASGFRYPETGWSRQSIGGCGVWNRDADWANNTVVNAINGAVRNAASSSGITNLRMLEMQNALVGRRLCENTVGLLEEKGVSHWTSAGAADKTEWVSQIRTTSTIFGPYQLQEGIHPSYWGQKALRNCLRQAWNGGAVRGGTCTRGANGLNGYGEPNMVLS